MAADSKDVSLPTSNENGAFDPDEDDKASLVIDVSTPKKTYKVGDIVNINVKIKNEGDVIAKGVLASISFSGDGFKIPSTLKFIDDKNDKVYVSDSGKVYIRPGNIAEEDTYSTTLRFIVKTIGDLTIIGYVDGINNYGANKVNTTIKIVAVHKDKKTGKKVGKKNMTHESSKNESSQANESSKTYDSSKTSTSAENKELLATGNPIALLGLVVILLSCIPYRRD